jgi:hypothetical protein
MMDIVEIYFYQGDEQVSSIIYTDFLATIMETKKEVREVIKKMMGIETGRYYKNLLNFYREIDTL